MGVALEIMLVLVCQLYPNHSEFDILHNFFNVFAKWPWADEHKGIVIIKGYFNFIAPFFFIVSSWSRPSPFFCRTSRSEAQRRCVRVRGTVVQREPNLPQTGHEDHHSLLSPGKHYLQSIKPAVACHKDRAFSWSCYNSIHHRRKRSSSGRSSARPLVVSVLFL